MPGRARFPYRSPPPPLPDGALEARPVPAARSLARRFPGRPPAQLTSLGTGVGSRARQKLSGRAALGHGEAASADGPWRGRRARAEPEPEPEPARWAGEDGSVVDCACALQPGRREGLRVSCSINGDPALWLQRRFDRPLPRTFPAGGRGALGLLDPLRAVSASSKRMLGRGSPEDAREGASPTDRLSRSEPGLGVPVGELEVTPTLPPNKCVVSVPE
ncbi:uncharacterized protein LOC131203905 [Ahaetulla prasina]|uniref:uncharacterized protein LOC131203905 n=1 Tax=Ahaetulla prasina TaxID=499056 RepID=UPI0026474744|nr:uncharacterized protein LOC131203905 [Ahaetulla prasina]